MKSSPPLRTLWARCLVVFTLIFSVLGISNQAFAESELKTQPATETSFLKSIELQVDEAFKSLNDFVAPVVFYDITFGVFTDASGETVSIPLIVGVIGIGAIVFTLYFGFINIKLFGHAIRVVSGKYDNPKDEGEITSCQPLSSALSATVALGNIAGILITVQCRALLIEATLVFTGETCAICRPSSSIFDYLG